MATCDNCGNELNFPNGAIKTICCNIVYRLRFRNEEERRKAAESWNSRNPLNEYGGNFVNPFAPKDKDGRQ